MKAYAQNGLDRLADLYRDCRICPRQCGVDRTRNERGFCRIGAQAVVSSAGLHFGEETPLVANSGSGTIFFSGCNLRCIFCQNWTIAHQSSGRAVSDEDLAEKMLSLQKQGAANINLVTPTHVVPNIIAAVRLARKQGLQLPIVYNTSSYDEVATIERLAEIVDIYLADVKWMDSAQAADLAEGTPADYPQKARAAVQAMFRQVGLLQVDASGRAIQGLMLRHLVLPNRAAGTQEFVHWVAEELSPDVYVNIMPQYRPEYKAYRHGRINRRIRQAEWQEALVWAREAGLTRLDERARVPFHSGF
jgi:putative pyruvate formate lyase activating enzyme